MVGGVYLWVKRTYGVDGWSVLMVGGVYLWWAECTCDG